MVITRRCAGCQGAEQVEEPRHLIGEAREVLAGHPWIGDRDLALSEGVDQAGNRVLGQGRVVDRHRDDPVVGELECTTACPGDAVQDLAYPPFHGVLHHGIIRADRALQRHLTGDDVEPRAAVEVLSS